MFGRAPFFGRFAHPSSPLPPLAPLFPGSPVAPAVAAAKPSGSNSVNDAAIDWAREFCRCEDALREHEQQQQEKKQTAKGKQPADKKEN